VRALAAAAVLAVPGPLHAQAAGDDAAEDAAADTSRSRWTPPDHGRVAALSLPGIRAGHLQASGEWMIGYDYELARRAGLRRFDDDVDPAGVIAPGGPFRAVPARLDVQRHVFVLAYGLHERITLRAEVPYLVTELRSERSAPGTFARSRFDTRSEGVGDLDLAAVVAFMEHGRQRVHFDIGLTAPTGGIHETDGTPDGRRRVPYAQQLGSGTWDLLSGVTYRAHAGRNFWGGQVATTFRFGANELDYRLGDSYQLALWAAREWTRHVSTSLRVSLAKHGTVQGTDPALPPPHASPAEDPGLQGGRMIELAPGVELQVPRVESHRLAFEFRVPVFESVDGPQLESDWSLRTGWRVRF